VQVHVDWDRCDGNGLCAIEAPDVFKLNDDDNLIVLQESPGESMRASVESAARLCPKHAIQVQG